MHAHGQAFGIPAQRHRHGWLTGNIEDRRPGDKFKGLSRQWLDEPHRLKNAARIQTSNHPDEHFFAVRGLERANFNWRLAEGGCQKNIVIFKETANLARG